MKRTIVACPLLLPSLLACPAGDTLRTTCCFDNPSPSAVNFGPRTSDEMCFDFITVFPYAAAKKTCSSLL